MIPEHIKERRRVYYKTYHAKKKLEVAKSITRFIDDGNFKDRSDNSLWMKDKVRFHFMCC